MTWCRRWAISHGLPRLPFSLYAAFWITAYIGAAGLLLVGVMVPVEWLSGVVLAIAIASIVLHLVTASLTRRVPVIRLIAGTNVVVFASVALASDKISSQTAAGIVGAVPLLSYFGYWFWRLASAPPRPGEALRPAKLLKECSWIALATVSAVLLIEFVQLNSLPFNEALGAWQGLPSLSVAFDLTFLELPVGEASFETELWVYCALALGWVSFAIVALIVIRKANTSARRLPSIHEDAATGPEYTMASPVLLVVKFITRTGASTASRHGRALTHAKEGAWHLVWSARNLRPACVGYLALLPLSAALAGGAGLAALLTLAIALFLVVAVLAGLAMVVAFVLISFLCAAHQLHFATGTERHTDGRANGRANGQVLPHHPQHAHRAAL